MAIISSVLVILSFFVQLFAFNDAFVVRVNGCHGVEYAGLGCFIQFSNTRRLPQSPDFVGTTFQLFTRENPTVGQDLDAVHRSTITNSNFDGSKPTKILVHGFLQDRTYPFLITTTRALLDNGDMNVIVVGWSGGAGFPYTQAAANTRLVGAQTARLVHALMEDTGLSSQNVHIVGHSLGAHVAGYVGERIHNLGRITALDPAQPNFHGARPDVRLDPTDANFVDVIHTDGTPYNTVGGYGLMEPVGHIDFYPNGGHNQPGCQDESSILGVMQDAWRHGLTNAESHISCSHERSVHLFAASIDFHSSCTFRAFACESEAKFVNGECTHCGNRPCPIMGYHADRFPGQGVYFLNTTGTDPFCGHHYFVSITLDSNMAYTAGRVMVQLVGVDGQTEWQEIKSGEVEAGDVISKMILSTTDTGDVTSVNVKFIHVGSLFSWGSETRLVLSKVQVVNLRRVHPKFFCPPDMIVENGQTLTLTQSSYHEEDCN